MVPPNLAASTPPRLSRFQGRHPLTCPGPRRLPENTGTDRPHALTPGTGVASSPPQRSQPWRLCRPRHASLRADPPPAKRGAGHESAPTPERRLVPTRAGEAGSVGSISGRGKRTVTPMSARRAAKSFGVDDAVYCSPSATEFSRLPTRLRRR